MSNSALKWAWSQTVAHPSHKLLLVALADRANDDAKAWPRQDKLAEVTGLGLRTVGRSLESLEKAGLILRETRHVPGRHGRMSDVYTLAIAQPFSAASDHSTRHGGVVNQHATVTNSTRHGGMFYKEEPSLNPKSIDPKGNAEPRRKAHRSPIAALPVSEGKNPKGAGKVHGKGKPSPADEPAFCEFWEAYPRKDDRLPAAKNFAKLSKADQALAVAAAPLYAAQVRKKQTPAEFVTKAKNWITAESFKNAEYAPATPIPVGEQRDNYRRLVGAFVKSGSWPDGLGPRPDEPRCRVPRDLLAEFGLAKPPAAPKTAPDNVIPLRVPENVDARAVNLASQRDLPLGGLRDSQKTSAAL